MIYINDKNGIFFANKNGFYHRKNGPAFIGEFIHSWYENGKRHRIGGPAYIDGIFQYWYIEGKKYSESEYHKKIKEMGLK